MANTIIICAVLLILSMLVALGPSFIPGLRNHKLPPGPPCLPVIGNLHQLPVTGAHLKFAHWAAKYGPIFSLKLGSRTAIVLSSPAVVRELIDKQSAIFSDRPRFYIADHHIMHGDHLMFQDTDARWRRGRRLYHGYFNERACEHDHVQLQNAEAVQLLRDLCTHPEAFMRHCRRFSNSAIMCFVTGIRTPTPDAIHMRRLYEVLNGLSEIFEPGATTLLDVFPWLRWFPERFVRRWRSRAQEVARTMDAIYRPLVDQVLERRRHGQNQTATSYLDSVLDQQKKLRLTRHEIEIMVGNLLEGGSDTLSTMLIAFIQAMALYPAVQRTAQAEIDAVIGPDHSPTWADYSRLPYVATVMKETMRWRPVLPTAFPHAARQAHTTVDGWTIPSGASIILNVWGLHHDPARYADPDEFDPSRYAGRTALAPVYAVSANYEKRDHYGYGSGRRLCPGIHLAERGLFIALAKVLWAFDIAPQPGPDGCPISINADPAEGYTDGFLRCAKPFQVDIRPRSLQRWQTIEHEFTEAERAVFSGYDVPVSSTTV